jgi:hypothetical protein
MPFDSTLQAGSGYVELHRVMTEARAWFSEDPARWIRSADFRRDGYNDLIAACWHGAMVYKAGLHNVFAYSQVFRAKFEPYLRAATGVTIGRIMSMNDNSGSLIEVLAKMDDVINRITLAISHNIGEAEAECERQQMTQDQKLHIQWIENAKAMNYSAEFISVSKWFDCGTVKLWGSSKKKEEPKPDWSSTLFLDEMMIIDPAEPLKITSPKAKSSYQHIFEAAKAYATA